MSLTRSGPSRLVPGAKGIFLTRAIKKFAPIEVAPPPHATAPLYMENLISAPRHTVSLRRFLALRHQFSTGMYFNVATPRGWYLLAPSNHAPLADAARLQAWRERHHHSYRNGGAKDEDRKPLKDMPATAPMRDKEKVTSSAEEDDTFGFFASPSSTTGHLRSRAHSPLIIQEDHFFEINDGVPWEMPPSDDLGSTDYWRKHKERMQLYEDTSVTVEQVNLFTSPQSTANESQEVGALTEEERYAHQLRLFQALTRKANVRLHVDDATRLLTLVPIVNLSEGEELLLHYGREWWSNRLLSTLFMSVSDNQMQSVRWIESLFVGPTDVARPFPMLCPATRRRRWKRGTRAPAAGADETTGKIGSLLRNESMTSNVVSMGSVLYNTMTKRRATDTEALAFALRRSCVDKEFFSCLVGSHGSGVFDVSRPDDEVPLRQVRRVLLQTLRQWRAANDVCTPKCSDEAFDGSFVF